MSSGLLGGFLPQSVNKYVSKGQNTCVCDKTQKTHTYDPLKVCRRQYRLQRSLVGDGSGLIFVFVFLLIFKILPVCVCL